MTVDLTKHTHAEAVAWLDSFARMLRATADRVSADRAAVWDAPDPTTAGRIAALIVAIEADGVAISAYDVRRCRYCGTPAQWHADNDHYPQSYTDMDA